MNSKFKRLASLSLLVLAALGAQQSQAATIGSDKSQIILSNQSVSEAVYPGVGLDTLTLACSGANPETIGRGGSRSITINYLFNFTSGEKTCSVNVARNGSPAREVANFTVTYDASSQKSTLVNNTVDYSKATSSPNVLCDSEGRRAEGCLSGLPDNMIYIATGINVGKKIPGGYELSACICNYKY